MGPAPEASPKASASGKATMPAVRPPNRSPLMFERSKKGLRPPGAAVWEEDIWLDPFVQDPLHAAQVWSPASSRIWAA